MLCYVNWYPILVITHKIIVKQTDDVFYNSQKGRFVFVFKHNGFPILPSVYVRTPTLSSIRKTELCGLYFVLAP